MQRIEKLKKKRCDKRKNRAGKTHLNNKFLFQFVTYIHIFVLIQLKVKIIKEPEENARENRTEQNRTAAVDAFPSVK